MGIQPLQEEVEDGWLYVDELHDSVFGFFPGTTQCLAEVVGVMDEERLLDVVFGGQ